MLELTYLQIQLDDEIAFQTVANIKSKKEGISYQRKYYGWKYKFRGSLKTEVTYVTPCKLK